MPANEFSPANGITPAMTRKLAEDQQRAIDLTRELKIVQIPSSAAAEAVEHITIVAGDLLG